MTEYRYDRPLSPNEVFVAVINTSGEAEFDGLDAAIEAAGRRYGYETGAFGSISAAAGACPAEARLRHFIYVPDRARTIDDVLADCDAALKAYGTGTIALSYDPAGMEAMGARIDGLKAKYPQLNFLMPVWSPEHGLWRPTFTKIVDNATCDSVRIKYRPRKIDEDVSAAIEDNRALFELMSQAYGGYGLYHRSPTDGFFAARVDADRFLITATKTDKINLDPRRISMVCGYDSATNILSYAGRYLPSSDAVEAAVIMASMPDIKMLFHTHASTRFTRNPRFESRRLVPPSSYGEPELGAMVVAALRKVGLNDFIIMEDHGEMIALTEHRALADYRRTLDALCALGDAPEPLAAG